MSEPDRRRSMRAWTLRSTGDPAEVLQLDDIDVPSPGENELLVDVEVAGASFADLLFIRGEYQVALPLPCVPGSELVGRVKRAGPGATTAEGTRVIGLGRPPDGAYAEQAIVIEQQSEVIPDDLPGPAAVCLIGNYVTAHLALHRRARLQPGELVVVHGGAGGVGSAAIQVAKAAGATVIAADLGASRAELCRQLGADVVVDSAAASLTDAVREHSHGRGADVVVDTVGGDLFEQSRRCIAFEGRLLIVGFTSGTIPELRMNQLILRSYSVVGVNALTVLEKYPEIHQQARQAVVQLLVAGSIAPLVELVVPFDDLPNAFAELAAGRVRGKAVIAV